MGCLALALLDHFQVDIGEKRLDSDVTIRKLRTIYSIFDNCRKGGVHTDHVI
jgi:hypothetical protein